MSCRLNARAGYIPHIVKHATEWPTVAEMVAAGIGIRSVAQERLAVNRAKVLCMWDCVMQVYGSEIAVSCEEDDLLVDAFVESIAQPIRW